MDTSETYIKMCEKAEEIQKDREITQWDYYTIAETNLIFNFKPDELVGHYLLPEVWVDTVPIYVPQYIWLPRDDQLQEMVTKPLKEKYGTIKASHEIQYLSIVLSDFQCLRHSSSYGARGSPSSLKQEEYVDQFTSMEQLWLAFVMKEKFNKKWDGENWNG